MLGLVRHFGALAAVTVTSFRKMLSILLSFVVFTKPFSATYVVGGVLVLAGIYANTAAKKYRERDARSIVMICLTAVQSLRVWVAKNRKHGSASRFARKLAANNI